MAFDVYPDPATAALLNKPPFAPLDLAPGEHLAAFAPLANLVGADPAQSSLPTTFLRIAISTASAAAATPALELSAADPLANPANARAIDPSANNLASATQLYDAVNPTSAALAYFAGVDGNMFLVKIVVEIPGTPLWLQLSNANQVACKYVWVVADDEADTAQPWINLVGPQGPGVNVPVVIDAYAGQPLELNAVGLTLQNFGSGASTIVSFSPPLPAPFASRGLPLTLAPNQISQRDLTLGVDKPTAGPRPPAVFRLATRDNNDPGPFGAQHNDGVTLSANVAVNNVWAPRANMMMGRMALAATAVANGGVIYAFGGVAVDRHPVLMIERFDVSANNWTNAGVMPGVLNTIAATLGRDGLIYVIGSRSIPDIGIVGAFAAFNPATGEWRSLAATPHTRVGAALAAGADGLIYAIGGRTVARQHGFSHALVAGPLDGSVDSYDPATNSWTSRQPMPTPRAFHGAASPDGRIIYAAGGANDTVKIATVEAFDLASGAWSTRAPMATSRSNFGFAASRNGKLYAAGGWDNNGNQIGQVEEFDPATGAWRPRADLAFPRGGLALASDASGRLHAIGGELRNFEVVEVFTP